MLFTHERLFHVVYTWTSFSCCLHMNVFFMLFTHERLWMFTHERHSNMRRIFSQLQLTALAVASPCRCKISYVILKYINTRHVFNLRYSLSLWVFFIFLFRQQFVHTHIHTYIHLIVHLSAPTHKHAHTHTCYLHAHFCYQLIAY